MAKSFTQNLRSSIKNIKQHPIAFASGTTHLIWSAPYNFSVLGLKWLWRKIKKSDSLLGQILWAIAGGLTVGVICNALILATAIHKFIFYWWNKFILFLDTIANWLLAQEKVAIAYLLKGILLLTDLLFVALALAALPFAGLGSMIVNTLPLLSPIFFRGYFNR